MTRNRFLLTKCTAVCRPRQFSPSAMSKILLAGWVLAASPAQSATPIGTGIQADGVCMDDAYDPAPGTQLGCTAKDTKVLQVAGTTTVSDPCDYPGDATTFTSTFEISTTAQQRWDLGLWFPKNAASTPYNGQCTTGILDPSNVNASQNLDSDSCGDINDKPSVGATNNPQQVILTLTAVCKDPDNDGLLELDSCLSWDNQSDSGNCSVPQQAFPSTSSKCNCSPVDTTIPVPPPQISVTKTPTPGTINEPGASVSFHVRVINPQPIAGTLTSLTDAPYGDITGIHDAITATDCSLATLPAGGSYECDFTANVSGSPGVATDTVTAVANIGGSSAGATASAEVTIADVGSSIAVFKTPVPSSLVEPGGDVTFNVRVRNTSTADSVTINTLNDDIHDAALQTGCAGSLPITLTPNDGNDGSGTDEFACSFTAGVTGNAGVSETDTVTAAGKDDDNADVSGMATATVTLTDSPSSITVSKSAAPDSLDEPGGDVTYTFIVTNTSAADSVTVDSLMDSIYGDLHGQGDCATPTAPIAPGSQYQCQITKPITGAPGYTVTNELTVSAKDDDNNDLPPITDSAIASIVNVPPKISVTKNANPTSVPETGGDVVFTVTVQNESSAESLTLSSLTDDIYGNVTQVQGKITATDCAAPQTLAAKNTAGDSYTCHFTAHVVGDYQLATTETDTVTAKADDDDLSPSDEKTAQATVSFTDVKPQVSVIKSASPDHVNETGGDVTYTFTVSNPGDESVTIESLVDDKFGALTGDADCQVGTVLAAAANCEFSMIKNLSGEPAAPHTNVLTVGVHDNDGNTQTGTGTATVNFDNVQPQVNVIKSASPDHVLETTGGDVTYTFTVSNPGDESVTIESLVDDKFGALTGDADCQVGTVLAAAANCEFSVLKTLSGEPAAPHTNVLTVGVHDNDGNTQTGTGTATVNFDNVQPQVSVIKSASPDHVNETGGDVTYTFTVSNPGDESVTIESLVDDKFGALTGDADCQVGAVLAAAASCEFSVTKTLSGEPAAPHTNVLTVGVHDNDGNTQTGTGTATVNFDNVQPNVALVKSVSPVSGLVGEHSLIR